MAFMTDEAFNHMGYKNETGGMVPCCDEAASSVFSFLFFYGIETELQVEQPYFR